MFKLKNTYHRGFLLGGLIIVLVLALSVILRPSLLQKRSSTGKKITVNAATVGTTKPFSYVENGQLTGHNIELVQEIFARLPQYQLVIKATSFSALFAGLDANRYQLGVNNFVVNNERKDKYLFSDPVFKDTYIAAVAVNDATLTMPRVNSFADFAEKSMFGIAGVNMTIAAENYNKLHPEAPIKINYGDENILTQLQQVINGKCDFILIDKSMFDFYQRTQALQLRAIELSPAMENELMQTPYSHIIVARGNEELLVEINRVLRAIIADGTSRRICEKYFGVDYSP